MFCKEHQGKLPPVECIVCLHEEVIRLKHIVATLKGQISMAYQSAASIEDHTRVRGGRLEVWCLGEWVEVMEFSVENEEADL